MDKSSLSQQRALAAKKAERMLGCLSKTIKASRSRGMIFPLYLAIVRPYLEIRAKFWATLYTREVNNLEECIQFTSVGTVKS